MRLMYRKLLERALGNTINRGVREAGLSRGRTWTGDAFAVGPSEGLYRALELEWLFTTVQN